MSQHAGTSLFDAEGNYQGDNELSVAAMQFLHDLVYVHQIAGIAPADAQNDWFGPAYWAAFKANSFTMLWGPPWHLGNLMSNVPEQSGKWAVQRLPTGLGECKPTANFGGTGQCITEQSKNPDICLGPDRGRQPDRRTAFSPTSRRARSTRPTSRRTSGRSCRSRPRTSAAPRSAELYASLAPDLPPFNQSPYFLDTFEAMVRIVITPVMTDKEQPEAALQALRAEVDRLKQA